MRKKLDTRFPAARIKKIMQADEDVGKIAMAVPVLVSKALELFLQDLCDRTYDITVQRGAKTVNSLHLKHCVHSYNVFDFLKEVVSKVPDYGHSDTTADITKRRKHATLAAAVEEEEEGAGEEDEDVPAEQVNFTEKWLNPLAQLPFSRASNKSQSLVQWITEESNKDIESSKFRFNAGDEKSEKTAVDEITEMDRMAIDPFHLPQLGEDDEDYDEEG
ncbi:nuclear factor Y [Striga asiatica]|uniref:Nuclear factor Y n=1 Tax=Striga asiatica TaxID=4170 RepID=A0A5A7PIN8_STRAF|nr:nuclear factor Y [Striga asiatica]